jgi:hypothetical protein
MYILLYPSWEAWGGTRVAWFVLRGAWGGVREAWCGVLGSCCVGTGCVRREVGNHVLRITFYFSRYNLLIIFRSRRCYAEP